MNWIQSIKQAVLRKVTDSTPYPQVQVEALGRLSTAYALSPYGICSRAPDASFSLVFDALCDPSVQIALAADPLNRFKDLAEGEVVVFNTKTPDSWVYLKANGDVDIQAESGTINLLGNVVVKDHLSVGTGVSGSFTSGDGQVIAVQDGIIIGIG